MHERVLICAPTADDGPLIAQILAQRGFEAVVLDGAEALGDEWTSGSGVLVVASEALTDDEFRTTLRQLLDDQESWSELPVILLGGSIADEAPREMLGTRAQLLILERPLGVATFVIAIEGALRSRRRQYSPHPSRPARFSPKSPNRRSRFPCCAWTGRPPPQNKRSWHHSRLPSAD